MPDFGVPASAFPLAPRAGFRTVSRLFSPTHFHEDPILLSGDCVVITVQGSLYGYVSRFLSKCFGRRRRLKQATRITVRLALRSSESATPNAAFLTAYFGHRDQSDRCIMITPIGGS